MAQATNIYRVGDRVKFIGDRPDENDTGIVVSVTCTKEIRTFWEVSGETHIDDPNDKRIVLVSRPGPEVLPREAKIAVIVSQVDDWNFDTVIEYAKYRMRKFMEEQSDERLDKELARLQETREHE